MAVLFVFGKRNPLPGSPLAIRRSLAEGLPDPKAMFRPMFIRILAVLRLSGFLLQQCTLASDAPAVAGEGAVRPNNPVAGNCDRNRVGCDGGGHRPNGFWQANAGSDFSVSGGGAGRDFAQSLPDPLLERSAANIQWKIASNTRLFDKADDLSNQ